MNIALVTPYDYPYPGGVTEHILHIDRELNARGNQTRIIAASSQSQEALASNVIKVNDFVTPIRFNGSMARLALSPDSVERVKAILDKEQFDVVHLHEPAVPLISLVAASHSHAVNVGTFHALLGTGAPARYAYSLLWPFLHNLDGSIFVSKPVRDAVPVYLRSHSRVIPNGIDYATFAAPGIGPIEAFDDGRPNLLFVGRMDERKGFRHLLRAYPRIKQAVPDARLLVVGAYTGEETAAFARYVRLNRLQDVHFIGPVSRDELSRYYRTATLFSAPSIGSESFGIVLLEAMAAGVPIVASAIPGYRSVLTDDQEGTLVEPGNELAIAAAVIRLLKDPRRRSAMAAQGRATAAEYDWPLVTTRVLNFYNELIEMRKTKARHPTDRGTNGPAIRLKVTPSWSAPKIEVKLRAGHHNQVAPS